MITLRVLFADVPSPDGAVAWARFDAMGRCEASGRSLPSALPRASRFEAVVAASHVRITSTVLPPMAASRVSSAATFAIEDQLAGAVDAQRLTASPQQPDGSVRVTIVDRSLLDAIASGNGVFPRPARIVAEPELASAAPVWRWCAADNQDGFVRCADGSAFPVDAPGGNGEIPTELALALGHARQDGQAPPEVLVDAPYADALLARWQNETGVAFRRGTPWRWQDAPAEAFSAAVDLSPTAQATAHGAPRLDRARLFAKALWIAMLAVLLHAAATAGEWAWQKVEIWQEARAWSTLAQGVGIAPEVAAMPSSASAALGRRYAELRHANGLDAPNDALPLLARAGPALTAIPTGVVRSMRYADGHWTLDLAGSDAAVLAELNARLRQTGVSALTAASAGTARVRIGPPQW